MSIKKDEKLEMLCSGFSLLDEGEREYIFGVLQALLFAKTKINENDKYPIPNGEEK
ncbi:MAG: hypothetical protein LBG26_04225 [Treponema sp.]|jgi:hypothetical protein|nr:hypothetical protein [Treponema sp.]